MLQQSVDKYKNTEVGLAINYCMILTSSSSIPCGHVDVEGEIMVYSCFQGDSNRPVLFNYCVGRLVEAHRDPVKSYK